MPSATVKHEEDDVADGDYENAEQDGHNDDDDLTDGADDASVLDDGQDTFRDGQFKLKLLNEAATKLRNVRALYEQVVSGGIKLDPEYQRDVVWDEKRASALIKSLMQGYYVPPLIFNVQFRPGHRATRICVDGKQRLSSLVKFIEGRIGMLDSRRRKWFFKVPINADGTEKVRWSEDSILPDEARKRFLESKFVCMEYKDLSTLVEEELFQLVQRGLPLTPAEKLRAQSTKWAVFTRSYEQEYKLVVDLVVQKRGAGFRTVLQIFANILEVASPSGGKRRRDEDVINVNAQPILQLSVSQLSALLDDKISGNLLDDNCKHLFQRVFHHYQRLVIKSSDKDDDGEYVLRPDGPFSPNPDFLRDIPHVKTFSPLEQLACAILIQVHGEDRSDDMLLGDIKELRHYLRECHKDLRLNSQCWKSTWEFIDNILVSRRGGNEAVPIRRRGAAAVREAGEASNANANAVSIAAAEALRANARPIARAVALPAAQADLPVTPAQRRRVVPVVITPPVDRTVERSEEEEDVKPTMTASGIVQARPARTPDLSEPISEEDAEMADAASSTTNQRVGNGQARGSFSRGVKHVAFMKSPEPDQNTGRAAGQLEKRKQPDNEATRGEDGRRSTRASFSRQHKRIKAEPVDDTGKMTSASAPISEHVRPSAMTANMTPRQEVGRPGPSSAGPLSAAPSGVASTTRIVLVPAAQSNGAPLRYSTASAFRTIPVMQPQPSQQANPTTSAAQRVIPTAQMGMSTPTIAVPRRTISSSSSTPSATTSAALQYRNNVIYISSDDEEDDDAVSAKATLAKWLPVNNGVTIKQEQSEHAEGAGQQTAKRAGRGGSVHHSGLGRSKIRVGY